MVQRVIIGVIVAIVLGGLGYGAYWAGTRTGKTVAAASPSPTVSLDPRLKSEGFIELISATNTNVAANQQYQTELLTTVADLDRYWKELGAATYDGETIPAPKINFEQEVVLLIIDRPRPALGFGISVDSVAQTAIELTVKVKQWSPSSVCVGEPTLNAPYTFVKIAKTNKPIAFASEQEIDECTG